MAPCASRKKGDECTPEKDRWPNRRETETNRTRTTSARAARVCRPTYVYQIKSQISGRVVAWLQGRPDTDRQAREAPVSPMYSQMLRVFAASDTVLLTWRLPSLNGHVVGGRVRTVLWASSTFKKNKDWRETIGPRGGEKKRPGFVGFFCAL